MDVTNIYGDIQDESEIIIGIGNYNSVHAILTYYNDVLQMQFLKDMISPIILELIIKYETPNFVKEKNKRRYFTLSVKDTNKYIGVNEIGDSETISACVSDNKTYYWIDYSGIDNLPREQIFSGTLYVLKTFINNVEYIVTWKIKGFTQGDVIMFFPTTWYEKIENVCAEKKSTISLIENFNRLSYKGYTNNYWCENFSHVTNCTDKHYCGLCFGKCNELTQHCHPVVGTKKFVCVDSDQVDQKNEEYLAVFFGIFFFVLMLFLILYFNYVDKI